MELAEAFRPKNTEDTGLVYLSTIPRFMSPAELRKELERFAAIGRIYLTPEIKDKVQKKGRRNVKRNFTEGWVEFHSKKEAKEAAETLNGQTIGGKKGSKYCEEMWTLKYLPKFKWHHLSEQMSTQNLT